MNDTSINHQCYKSKLFRTGNILLALVLAVRGLPRTWQPEEQPVTRQSGWKIYADEIELLDSIDPHLRIFQSGVLAAALMTVAIDPAVLEFWRQVNEERWTRHRDGCIDPAGWLLQQILRHSGNREVALRPEYQHYLFQSSLAAAMAWCEQSEPAPFAADGPSRVAIDALLEQVRTTKGLRRAPDGFRTVQSLRGRIPRLGPSVIEHSGDIKLAARMAAGVAHLNEFSHCPEELSAARQRLAEMDIPGERAAPGVLAACLVSLARDPSCAGIWNDVWAGRWSHDPDLGSDVAGLITRSIDVHNRRREGVKGQARLFARVMMAIKSHVQRTGVRAYRRKNISQSRRVWVSRILDAWQALPIDDGPIIHIGQVQTVYQGEPADQARAPCQYRQGRGRGRTGRQGELLFERYHRRSGKPRPGRLIDRTHEQVGYDYALESDGEPLWVCEVKTIDRCGFRFTEKQWRTAEQMRECYWLILVEDGGDGEPTVHCTPDPFRYLNPRKETQLIPRTEYVVSVKDMRNIRGRALPLSLEDTANVPNVTDADG